MFTQLADALAPASLSSTERRVVGRLVERLQEELGPNLHAIWLYGSRARAETPHAESDIDLMVIASGSTWNNGVRAIKLTQEVADAQGVSPVWYSTQVVDPDWIVGRREIHSFFIQEVDRDKNCSVRRPLGVSPRSTESMHQARDRAAIHASF